jgi:meiotic recombination protein SPO11
VLVLEKDAIFQRLIDDGFPEASGSILVTAKGNPDLATRAFLHALVTALPRLRPLAGPILHPCYRLSLPH